MTPVLLRTLRGVVDARAGIANRLWELAADPLTPDLFVAAVAGPAASYFIDRDAARWSNSSVGSGAGFSRDQSLWATIGETIERYAGSIYDRGDFTLARASELPARTIDLAAMIGFTDRQYAARGFPFRRYDPARPRQWVAGVAVPSGQPVFAPAQLVYLSQEWSDGDLLAQTVSSGLAAHVDRQRVIAAGLLELIERDGFASAWLLRYPPPRLVLSPEHLAALSPPCRAALTRSGLDIALHVAPNEFGVPNVFAFAESPVHGYGVVGASARLGIVEAVEKAVVEVLHGWSATARARQGQEALPEREAIVKPHDHSLYHLQPHAWAELAWFRGSREELPSAAFAETAPRDTDDLIDRITRAGFEISAFDLTTDDVAALGFQVVRTIVPGLQPLTFGLDHIPDDRRRLRQNARTWGIAMPATLNHDPHPFP